LHGSYHAPVTMRVIMSWILFCN